MDGNSLILNTSQSLFSVFLTQIKFSHGLFEQFIDWLSRPKIGNDKFVRPTTRQNQLLAVIGQPTVKDTPELFQFASLAAKLHVLQNVFSSRTLKTIPISIGIGLHHCVDNFIQFVATDIADIEFA